MVEETNIYDLLYYKSIREQVVEKLNRAVIPIYNQSNQELIGTGVLIKFIESYFLITANHVINDIDDNFCFYVPKTHEYVQLNEGKLDFIFDFGKRDIIDLCLIKINVTIYPDLFSNFNFIDVSYLQVNQA
jgi:hypothetical protein